MDEESSSPPIVLDHSNPLDSPTNHSTLIKALSWIAIITSFLFIAVRCGMKWTNTKKIGLDDLAIMLSLIFGVVATIVVSIAANYGYGSTDTVPDDATQLLIEKLIYAFNILFFFSLACSMLSITDLVYHISPAAKHRRFALATAVGIVVWMIIAVLVFAFQCQPNGYAFLTSEKCINRAGFYTVEALVNLLLEINLVLQPTILTWALNMSVARRVTVITCFMGRIGVIGLLIAKIVLIWHRDFSQDILMEFGFVLTTIFILNISIIAACTPYLRPFFISLTTAQLDMTELPNLRTGRSSSMYPRGSKTTNSSGAKSGPRTPVYTSATKSSKRSSKVWQPSAQDLGSNKSWKFEKLNPASSTGKLRPDDTGKRSATVTTDQVPDQDAINNIEHRIDFSVQVETLPANKTSTPTTPH